MAALTLLIHKLARREYHAAFRWYAQQSLRAALGFQDEIERTLQQIVSAPSQGAMIYRNHRWMRTRRFPYVLYYRMADADHVLVVAVAHAGQRPGYWLRRDRV